MNELAVMNYISRHLHTCICKYDCNIRRIFSCCVRKDFNVSLLQSEEIAKLLCEFFTYTEQTEQEEELPDPGHGFTLPCMISTDDGMIYSVIPCSHSFYILGPNRFTNTIPINRKLSKGQLFDSQTEESVFSSLYPCDFLDYVRVLLLLYNLEEEKTQDETDIIQENCIALSLNDSIQKVYMEMTFERHENEQPHNPYDQEVREQSSIENGDIPGLKESLGEDYMGTVGTLAKNPLRNAKNLAIVLITLASRSAIRGGIASEISFSLSDSYIQKTEECTDSISALQIARNAEYEYATMVHDLKQQQNGTVLKEKNPYVRKCKDYIFSHLHDKLTVKELADALNINANYLSEIFKRHEGISLAQFILHEKINRAKNLLTYSRYSYIEIAAYLGFSSQSHLGMQFKKITGYTLRQYRNKFGV